jgi:diguanylate cyclase (GGDEF)-like protein
LTATSVVAGDDVITGLPNRAKFLEELEVRLETLRRINSPHCIAMVRIDRFGDLRAERGMRASELVLQRTAERLQETMREGDIVARFDRDTFVLSLAELSAEDAPGAVERLRRSACQEIQLEVEGAASIIVTASSSFAAVDPDSEASQLVACCRGALAMARSEESLAVS